MGRSLCEEMSIARGMWRRQAPPARPEQTIETGAYTPDEEDKLIVNLRSECVQELVLARRAA
jgi:hypothetical protein